MIWTTQFIFVLAVTCIFLWALWKMSEDDEDRGG